jgi:hypothetical protein
LNVTIIAVARTARLAIIGIYGKDGAGVTESPGAAIFSGSILTVLGSTIVLVEIMLSKEGSTDTEVPEVA